MIDEVHCDLYVKFAEEAGSSASLEAYVKRALQEHFSVKIEMLGRQHEQMLLVVREEMQTQDMKPISALMAGIRTVNVLTSRKKLTNGDRIPGACGILPEELNRVLDLIG